MIFSIINSLIVFSLAIYVSLYMTQGKSYVPLISWSMLAIGLVYGIGSSIVFYESYSSELFLGSEIIAAHSEYWPLHGILTLSLIFGIILGWKAPLINIKNVNSFFEFNKNQLIFISFTIFFIGFFLRWIYVQAFGGFGGYLEYSRLIRSGIFEIDNPYSFLQPFGYLVVLACYLFFSILIKNKNNLIVALGFFLSFFSSLYILYSNVGRVAFITFLASLLLINLYYKGIKPYKIILFLLFSFPLVFLFLYFLSNYFEVKGAENPFSYFVKEVSFVFATFLVQYSEGNLYRFFLDFIIAPIHFLPSSFTQNIYETASQTNTILFYGAKKGDESVTGGIPVDLLSLGVMQLNVFGVLPVGFLFGYLLKNFDDFLLKIKNSYIQIALLPYISLRISFMGVLYAHSDHFISGMFPIVTLLIVMVMVKVSYFLLPKK